MPFKHNSSPLTSSLLEHDSHLSQPTERHLASRTHTLPLKHSPQGPNLEPKEDGDNLQASEQV
ncbi:hypothetical protein M404DRAFT_998937, partial [Pisolithus tinctorius Marx 270]